MARFTKKALALSFLKLLNKMPLDKITVKDIVNDCGVNRNTFYYYYQDIYALLEEILSEETAKAAALISSASSWTDTFIADMGFTLQNKSAIYHIYNSMSRQQFDKYLFNIANTLMQKIVADEAEGTGATKEDIRVVGEFYACAMAGVVLMWVANGMKTEPVVDIKRAGELFTGNIKDTLIRSAQTRTPQSSAHKNSKQSP